MKTRTIVIGGVIGAVVLLFLLLMFLRVGDMPSLAPPETEITQASPPPDRVRRPSLSAAQASPPPVEGGFSGFINPQDRLGAIDRTLEKLEFGNIAFNVPKTMNLRDTALIQLVLSLGIPIDDLKQMIEAVGEKEGTSIRVSDRMEARLSGPDFAITAITPEIQAVSKSDVTEWKWEVKPKSDGNHYLHLTLSAILSVEGGSTPRAIRTFDKVIEVEVAWHQRVGPLFEKNWQWLWAAILVPVSGWLWKRKKKSKSEVSETDG